MNFEDFGDICVLDAELLDFFVGVVVARRVSLLELHRDSEVVRPTMFDKVAFDLVEFAGLERNPLGDVLVGIIDFWGDKVVSPLSRPVARSNLSQGRLDWRRRVEWASRV